MLPSSASLHTVSDQALLDALRELADRDAGVEADLLAHLGEVDTRRLHLAQGFPSLFAYCIEVLHFSESVAYQRITAARAARAFPTVLERVRTRELHLSGLRLLAPHLTQENHGELLDLARHRSKRAIEELLADRAPKPEVRPQVRRVPEHRTSKAPRDAAPPSRTPPAGVPALSAPPPHATAPLGQARYKVQFTAGAEVYTKLREAQALLRHQIPDGDLGRLFERALDALLREVRRTRFAQTDRPRASTDRPSSGVPTPRHIPAAIRRAVVARDRERCAFVAPDGRRCAAVGALEFHHVNSFARSQRHRVEEIELRCRAHNAYAACQEFGAEHMSRFQRRDRPSASTGPGASRDP